MVATDKAVAEGVNPEKIKVQRFKGLGEMNPAQLYETTMNPDTRRVVPLFVAPGEEEQTEGIFLKCLGKKEAQARREWIERDGNMADADI